MDMKASSGPQYLARRRRRQLTHEHICEVAADAFYKRGLQRVSMDDVAAEAGVTKATLYKHFASKDALISASLEAVDQQHFNWFVEQVGSRVAGGADALPSVFAVLDTWIHSPVFRGCAFINASIQLANERHPAYSAVLNHKARTVDWLVSLAASDGLDPDAARELAGYLMILMEGAIVTALVQDNPDAGRQAGKAAAIIIDRFRGQDPD